MRLSRCENCPPPRKYDSREVIKTQQDLHHGSRPSTRTSMAPDGGRRRRDPRQPRHRVRVRRDAGQFRRASLSRDRGAGAGQRPRRKTRGPRSIARRGAASMVRPLGHAGRCFAFAVEFFLRSPVGPQKASSAFCGSARRPPFAWLCRRVKRQQLLGAEIVELAGLRESSAGRAARSSPRPRRASAGSSGLRPASTARACGCGSGRG